MMIEGKYIYNYDDLQDVSFLMEDIFHDTKRLEELKKADIYTKKVLYAVAYQDKNPVAVGTLLLEDGICSVEKIGVRTEERKKGYGEFIVLLMIDKAFLLGADEINLNCNKDVVPFFKRFGFMESSMEKGKEYSRVLMVLKKDCVKRGCSNHCN